MSLSSDPVPIPRKIGPYQILGELGHGGMGTVYRAHDARLQRDVALKILHGVGTEDPRRLKRFLLEARTAGALNHPNIVTVHDAFIDAHPSYVVTELIEGVSLRAILSAGPVPLPRLLDLAVQIADGLTAAHGANVVHRDLKPENIMVTTTGRVKIVDFGLAKDLATDEQPVQTMTAAHAIVGTPSYMSTEQARGAAVDFRSDLFALGAILYEMATGRRAFERSTTIETLTAILHDEPPIAHEMRNRIPRSLERIVRRCLAKEPAERYAASADLLYDLRILRDETRELTESGIADEVRLPPKRAKRASVAAIAILGALVIGAIGAVVGRISSTDPSAGRSEVTRAFVGVAPAEQLAPRPTRTEVVLSPDGRRLVFSGMKNGRQQLYVLPLDQREASPIPGTEGSNSPFFSPDGRWIGFWVGQLAVGAIGELKKVRIGGGDVVPLAKTAPLFGASWGSDDQIVFANAGGALMRIPAGGGTPLPLTSVDATKETSHRLPHVLPDARGVLYTVPVGGGMAGLANANIAVRSLETGEQRTLIEGGSDARYVATGHIVFAKAGTLMAVPFDLSRLMVTGVPTAIAGGVAHATGPNNQVGVLIGETGAAQFSLSTSGTLVFLPAVASPAVVRSLSWVDRQGRSTPIALSPRSFAGPRISPDGQRILVSTVRQIPSFWMYDVGRRTLTALLPGQEGAWPIWMPDGKQATMSTSGPPAALISTPVDGGPIDRIITEGVRSGIPGSWSPDAKVLVFTRSLSSAGWEIRVWSREAGERKLRPSTPIPIMERFPTFSPDGRWLAYTSDESGREEVWVEGFPNSTERHQISADGGVAPAWSRDGDELFYLEQPAELMRMMAVNVNLDPPFRAGRPKRLFEGRYFVGSPMRSYDVAADGRFIMTQEVPQPPAPAVTQIPLVLNWAEELKRLAPSTSR